MAALVLDAGALMAVDNHDRTTVLRLRAAQRRGIALRTSAIVVGEVWRDPQGRQTQLARLLGAIDVRSVDLDLGRAAGVLVGRAGTDDPVDATVVLIAETGDRILTSDPGDIDFLARAARKSVVVVAC